MRRLVLIPCTLFVFAALLPAQDANLLKDKPITTAQGKVGELLRQWWKEGTAAGNVGDWYDNRDGAHSDLNTAPYPQLQRIVYSEEDIKFRKHWAAQRLLHKDKVVFGNSSTSAPPTSGGSNPRMYYVSPPGLNFLYQQYVSNNLYIYPEHRDHDPGRNGVGDGYGDLYPTNTPYLLISQGSSGSDQPFMRAVPFALAALRPEVKKKLVESGALMPTLQMLLRSTNKHLKDPKEYLTGKAHPTVFEGSAVNDLGLVQAAHALTLETLPPVVQLQVMEEDSPRRGIDFFDVPATEKLADTPCVIARIWRGNDQKRSLVVSAQKSLDLNQKPLTFTWTVLRGDAERIQITPRNKEGTLAEIVVHYHERRPISPGSAMESNRVDIGVFAHNGSNYSAPAFVTFFTLDNEARTYDDKGRIIEIGYGIQETRLASVSLAKFMEELDKRSATMRLLGLGVEQRVKLLGVRPQYVALTEEAKKWGDKQGVLQKELAVLNVKLKEAPKDEQLLERKKSLEKEKADADKAQKAAQQAADDFAKKTGITDQARQAFEALLVKVNMLADNFPAWQEALAKGNYAAHQKQAVSLGLLAEAGAKQPQWMLARDKPTRFESLVIQRFNASCLEDAFPGMVTFQSLQPFVDQRLAAPKKMWRDFYRYDESGAMLGWTRHHAAEGKQEFNEEGHLIVEKDAEGRCTKAHPVRYLQDPPKMFGLNSNPLRMTIDNEVVSYPRTGTSN